MTVKYTFKVNIYYFFIFFAEKSDKTEDKVRIVGERDTERKTLGLSM